MIVKDMKTWHGVIYKKYKGICQGCHNFFYPDSVCGHHVKTKGSRPDLKLETDIGVLLCNSPSKFNFFGGCHNMVHTGRLKVKQIEGEYLVYQNIKKISL